MKNWLLAGAPLEFLKPLCAIMLMEKSTGLFPQGHFWNWSVAVLPLCVILGELKTLFMTHHQAKRFLLCGVHQQCGCQKVRVGVAKAKCWNVTPTFRWQSDTNRVKEVAWEERVCCVLERGIVCEILNHHSARTDYVCGTCARVGGAYKDGCSMKVWEGCRPLGYWYKPNVYDINVLLFINSVNGFCPTKTKFLFQLFWFN